MQALVAMLPALVERAGAAAVASWLAPRALVACMLGDTNFAAAALELLRAPDSPGAQQVAAAFPELVALAHPAPAQIEHDPGTDRPLLDHVATRLLGTKLLGLEARDAARWRGLLRAAFDDLAATAERVLAAGLGPALRAAILHLDIAKTQSAPHRAAWSALGIALDVHNEASAAIVRKLDRGWGLPPALHKLAIAWIEAHGLAGQHARGEGPILMFAPLVAALRELAPALGRVLGVEPHRAIALALDGLHVINACDTAAVREGLVDDALLARLARVRDQIVIVAAQAAWTDPFAQLAALAPPADRAHLAHRLHALRAGRGEPLAAAEAAVAALDERDVAVLAPALATCQLWYCEAATSRLSPGGQLAVLAAAVGAARTMGVDVARPWHAQLRPLVARLAGDDAAARYRLRLIEAALARTPLADLLAHRAHLGPLAALSARLASAGGPDAIVLDFVDTAESAALITLLGLYETRSQAAYHQMLKSLCDLYGLRKDDFDRVHNEAAYLASMNAARDDKQRMLDYVRPGQIVEIGPGGGVVLDLLAARFPGSTITGVDASSEVVDVLARRGRRVVHGTAAELSQLFAPGSVDTVVFCSILHEVYSYAGFRLDAVRDAIRAAWQTLRAGGRIVIRDGVMPPPATRRLRFVAADARPTFDLYVAQFEGRKIQLCELPPDVEPRGLRPTGGVTRVELSAADAMEFLYTYTWGPASFPYEVRELYGIMPYDAYVATVLDWCGADARVVEVPRELRSYLQPGYRTNLAGKIELTDEHDRPADLPDSNCLIVIEKAGPTPPSRTT